MKTIQKKQSDITLVEVSYVLVYRLKPLRRWSRRKSSSGDSDVKKVLVVIKSEDLSQDTVTEQLKKGLQRSHTKSVEVVSYRTVESEKSDSSHNIYI